MDNDAASDHNDDGAMTIVLWTFTYRNRLNCQNVFSDMILQSDETRAPRGTDRSPEYKEHFCYKLDSRVKNETTEWNQKQQHFIIHALDHCYEFGLLL